jgi:hypothetical protein
MINSPYKPRPSSYSRAYSLICRLYEKNNHLPLGIDKVRHAMKCEPGLHFADGITLEDVFDTLKTWRLILPGKVNGLEGEKIVPLDWEK